METTPVKRSLNEKITNLFMGREGGRAKFWGGIGTAYHAGVNLGYGTPETIVAGLGGALINHLIFRKDHPGLAKTPEGKPTQIKRSLYEKTVNFFAGADGQRAWWLTGGLAALPILAGAPQAQTLVTAGLTGLLNHLAYRKLLKGKATSLY